MSAIATDQPGLCPRCRLQRGMIVPDEPSSPPLVKGSNPAHRGDDTMETRWPLVLIKGSMMISKVCWVCVRGGGDRGNWTVFKTVAYNNVK